MKYYYNVVAVICLLLSGYRVGATAQEPDWLIFQGKTYPLQSNPLEGWLNKRKQRPTELVRGSTACWRGYQATWLLEDNQLFLLEIRPACNAHVRAISLKQWFRPDTHGRVPATWVEGNLNVPLGKLLQYEHTGYESIYEKDWILTLRNGRLIRQHTYHNRVNQQVNAEQFSNQLHQAIDWASLPKQLPAQCRVFVQFKPDSTGLTCAVSIVKGCDAIFDAEALQAARQVARRNWGATYRYGRWMPFSWTAPISFTVETRRKFSQH